MLNPMKIRTKPPLTDLQKADCLTGTMMGGIALKSSHFGQGKRRRLVFEDRDCHYHAISRVAGGELALSMILRIIVGVVMLKLWVGVSVLCLLYTSPSPRDRG